MAFVPNNEVGAVFNVFVYSFLDEVQKNFFIKWVEHRSLLPAHYLTSKTLRKEMRGSIISKKGILIYFN